MLALKYLLLTGAIGLFIAAVAVLAYDLYAEYRFRRAEASGSTGLVEREPVRWRVTAALVALAWAPLLIALSIIVVPSGMAGVRVSQLSGTRPGTLYPGVHLVAPMVDHVEMFDTRDHIYTTGIASDSKTESKIAPVPDKDKKPAALNVQAREGLTLGLAVTVRYQLDPQRLDYIQTHLPQPIDTELVPPVVASAWRELVPNYTVRDVFSAKREEIRKQAEETITKKLGKDGIRVKEVMLRDIQLPPEYAKGLETLLLKEQENDRLGVETEIHAKQVKIAELDAEAQKVQEVKQAEGQAQVQVLQAKGQADAMQYTLPLKEKQIQQSKLEAEARKEATIMNAEAAAQAKVIDSKAELQRRNLLADAEANRIRVTSKADAERMQAEAVVLKQNPLLINKIVAERLSDKIQVMMVPSDGKFFFANDVLRSLSAPAQADDPPSPGSEESTVTRVPHPGRFH